MSESETGENDPQMEAVQHEEEEEAEPEPVTWTEAQAGFEKRRSQRRQLEVDMPDRNAVAVFTVRGLKQEERDEVEAAAVSDNQKRRQRRGGDGGIDLSSLDMGAVRDKQLEYGIVDGPEGFNPAREDHRRAIPPGVKDKLVEEIDDLSSLDVDERETFQASR